MRRNLYILWLFWLVGCTEERIVTAPQADHQPPFITWQEPAPNSELSGDAEIAFMATDPSGVSRISVFRNGLNPPDWTFTPESQDTLHTLIWNTRDDSDGLYILEIHAWDEAGNLGVSPTLMVRVRNQPEPPPEDRTPPDLWWESPEGGATLKDTVTLRLGWFDESGVDSVTVWRNGRRSAVFTVQGADGVQEIFWDTSQDSDGVYLWEARGWDAAGNEGRSSGLLVRVLNHQPPREDRNPPVITWVSPQSGAELQGLTEIALDALDDSGIDSVRIYLSGATPEIFHLIGREVMRYTVNWQTREYQDGQYLLEARAWDSSGNVSFSEPLSVTVWNLRPRVLWVPDEFETIQDAVWHSENGDTIMVRAGEYEEQLQFFDKRVSLISEVGPERTVIRAVDPYTIAWITGGQDTTMIIRGFTFINTSNYVNGAQCLILDGGASPKVVNNVFAMAIYEGNLGDYAILAGQSAAIIRNNTFTTMSSSVWMASCWGDFSNNMIIHCSQQGFFNGQNSGQPLVPDYNLFWDYGRRVWGGGPMLTGHNNIIDLEPIFLLGSWRLDPNSPGINHGRPELFDIDGSRSDIGVYGGPYGYP